MPPQFLDLPEHLRPDLVLVPEHVGVHQHEVVAPVQDLAHHVVEGRVDLDAQDGPGVVAQARRQAAVNGLEDQGFTALSPLYGPVRPQVLAGEAQVAAALRPQVAAFREKQAPAALNRPVERKKDKDDHDLSL